MAGIQRYFGRTHWSLLQLTVFRTHHDVSIQMDEFRTHRAASLLSPIYSEMKLKIIVTNFSQDCISENYNEDTPKYPTG